MIRRTNRAAYGYLAFALIMMLMMWETNKSQAAVADSGIPREAIRIRIIANSDAIADQTVKRVIRDQVASELEGWITEPDNVDAARETIKSHLGEIETLVGSALRERGFDYPYRVEFGATAFPEKMFGPRLYPAANYEAVKVTLGAGKGQNWWCVLFPPLCLADAVAQEKKEQTAAGEEATNMASGKTSGAASDMGKAVQAKGKAGAESAGSTGQQAQELQEDGGGQKPEARFFLVDVLVKFVNWLKGLFA